MKYAEFNMSNKNIEFHNSMIGVERVVINDITVSKKFSFSGATHKLPFKGCILKSNKQFDSKEIELTLIKDGEIIDTQIKPTDRKKRFFLKLIIFCIGIGAYRLLNYLLQFAI